MGDVAMPLPLADDDGCSDRVVMGATPADGDDDVADSVGVDIGVVDGVREGPSRTPRGGGRAAGGRGAAWGPPGGGRGGGVGVIEAPPGLGADTTGIECTRM
jgi:hypothetical protein